MRTVTSGFKEYRPPQHLALRARIILLAADGMGVGAEEVGVWPKRRGSPRRSWRCGASLMGSHQLFQRVALLGRNRHRLGGQ